MPNPAGLPCVSPCGVPSEGGEEQRLIVDEIMDVARSYAHARTIRQDNAARHALRSRIESLVTENARLRSENERLKAEDEPMELRAPGPYSSTSVPVTFVHGGKGKPLPIDFPHDSDECECPECQGTVIYDTKFVGNVGNSDRPAPAAEPDVSPEPLLAKLAAAPNKARCTHPTLDEALGCERCQNDARRKLKLPPYHEGPVGAIYAKATPTLAADLIEATSVSPLPESR